jgi:hypothetical protein
MASIVVNAAFGKGSDILISSPLMGEDKGEGAILITPHPYLLPQGEKELDRKSPGNGFS